MIRIVKFMILLFRSIIQCKDRDLSPQKFQRGIFWVLKNYVAASHGNLSCHESVTLSATADYTFLDNVIPMLQRWQAPLSIAVYAPGTDFFATLSSIIYLRKCHSDKEIVVKLASFHIFFESKHMFKNIPVFNKRLENSFICPETAPYANVSRKLMYKTVNKLLFPISIGRNVAREAALTHFVFPCDIELYPNPNFVDNFFEMLIKDNSTLIEGNK